MTFNFYLIWQFLLVLLFIYRSSQAQENTYLLHGKLLEENTLEPVSGASIGTPHQQVISDAQGNFIIQVSSDTQLRISHIGYETKEVKVGEKPDKTMEIFLVPAIVELDGVTVRLPSEEELKQLILNTEVPVSYEEAILQQNVTYMTKIQHLGYSHDMNSFDTFLRQMASNGSGISLFSNNPSVGIRGAIRRLRQDRSLPARRPYSEARQVPSLQYTYKRKEGQYKWLFE